MTRVPRRSCGRPPYIIVPRQSFREAAHFRAYILSDDYLPHAAVIINPAGARSWRRWPFSLRMRCTRPASRVGRNLMTASPTSAAGGGLTYSKKCGRPMFTFRVRRTSRGEMYIGHARLCVCVSVCRRVCLSVCPLTHSHTTARTRM